MRLEDGVRLVFGCAEYLPFESESFGRGAGERWSRAYTSYSRRALSEAARVGVVHDHVTMLGRARGRTDHRGPDPIVP